jgi:hypothetical protein
MKQLLQEIDELIQEKEDSPEKYDKNGNWCHPSMPTITKAEFDGKIRERINAYVRRLAKQALYDESA